MKLSVDAGVPFGKIEATPTGWCLSYVLAGPDARYRATLLELGPQEVAALAADFAIAYRRYVALKASLPPGHEVVEPIGANLTVRIGPFAEGVCLGGYHDPVRHLGQIQARVAALEALALRGPAMVEQAAALAAARPSPQS